MALVDLVAQALAGTLAEPGPVLPAEEAKAALQERRLDNQVRPTPSLQLAATKASVQPGRVSHRDPLRAGRQRPGSRLPSQNDKPLHAPEGPGARRVLSRDVHTGTPRTWEQQAVRVAREAADKAVRDALMMAHRAEAAAEGRIKHAQQEAQEAINKIRANAASEVALLQQSALAEARQQVAEELEEACRDAANAEAEQHDLQAELAAMQRPQAIGAAAAALTAATAQSPALSAELVDALKEALRQAEARAQAAEEAATLAKAQMQLLHSQQQVLEQRAGSAEQSLQGRGMQREASADAASAALQQAEAAGEALQQLQLVRSQPCSSCAALHAQLTKAQTAADAAVQAVQCLEQSLLDRERQVPCSSCSTLSSQLSRAQAAAEMAGRRAQEAEADLILARQENLRLQQQLQKALEQGCTAGQVPAGLGDGGNACELESGEPDGPSSARLAETAGGVDGEAGSSAEGSSFVISNDTSALAAAHACPASPEPLRRQSSPEAVGIGSELATRDKQKAPSGPQEPDHRAAPHEQLPSGGDTLGVESRQQSAVHLMNGILFSGLHEAEQLASPASSSSPCGSPQVVERLPAFSGQHRRPLEFSSAAQDAASGSQNSATCASHDTADQPRHMISDSGDDDTHSGAAGTSEHDGPQDAADAAAQPAHSSLRGGRPPFGASAATGKQVSQQFQAGTTISDSSAPVSLFVVPEDGVQTEGADEQGERQPTLWELAAGDDAGSSSDDDVASNRSVSTSSSSGQSDSDSCTLSPQPALGISESAATPRRATGTPLEDSRLRHSRQPHVADDGGRVTAASAQQLAPVARSPASSACVLTNTATDVLSTPPQPDRSVHNAASATALDSDCHPAMAATTPCNLPWTHAEHTTLDETPITRARSLSTAVSSLLWGSGQWLQYQGPDAALPKASDATLAPSLGQSWGGQGARFGPIGSTASAGMPAGASAGPHESADAADEAGGSLADGFRTAAQAAGSGRPIPSQMDDAEASFLRALAGLSSSAAERPAGMPDAAQQQASWEQAASRNAMQRPALGSPDRGCSDGAMNAASAAELSASQHNPLSGQAMASVPHTSDSDERSQASSSHTDVATGSGAAAAARHMDGLQRHRLHEEIGIAPLRQHECSRQGPPAGRSRPASPVVSPRTLLEQNPDLQRILRPASPRVTAARGRHGSRPASPRLDSRSVSRESSQVAAGGRLRQQASGLTGSAQRFHSPTPGKSSRGRAASPGAQRSASPGLRRSADGSDLTAARDAPQQAQHGQHMYPRIPAVWNSPYTRPASPRSGPKTSERSSMTAATADSAPRPVSPAAGPSASRRASSPLPARPTASGSNTPRHGIAARSSSQGPEGHQLKAAGRQPARGADMAAAKRVSLEDLGKLLASQGAVPPTDAFLERLRSEAQTDAGQQAGLRAPNLRQRRASSSSVSSSNRPSSPFARTSSTAPVSARAVARVQARLAGEDSSEASSRHQPVVRRPSWENLRSTSAILAGACHTASNRARARSVSPMTRTASGSMTSTASSSRPSSPSQRRSAARAVQQSSKGYTEESDMDSISGW